MQRKSTLAAIVATVAFCLGTPALAEGPANQQDLLKALPSAKVTLQQGMAASAKNGTPVSAKYELEEGTLQLSVYTAKAGKFNEVIVDYTTGKVAKVKAIEDGEDLSHARAQTSALAKTHSPLHAAADKAERENPGFRTVSLTPSLDSKQAVVQVVLARGGETKTVSEKLE